MPFEEEERQEDGIWTPVADMMTALMVVFMILVVALTTKIQGEIEADEALKMAQQELQGAFAQTFSDFAGVGGAEIDTMNLTVRFFDNAATFSIGSTSLQPAFHRRLDDLIPEVIAYATADTLWPLISEIRIEGHTSSEWNHDVSERDAYVLNMELSQGRTRSVLNYFLQHPVVRNHPRHTEIQRRLTANGLSSSHPILDSLGREDSARSRRVEIRFQEKRDQETIDYMRRKYAATR